MTDKYFRVWRDLLYPVVDKELNIIQELRESSSLIISGFPGTGKSVLTNSFPDKISDSDSSKFNKNDFPNNYIQHINDIKNKFEIIFVSSHDIVRDALVNNNIPFILVYPDKELKQEYIQRYIKRGNDERFINLVKDNWDSWIDGLDSQEGCYKIKLKSNEFIKDYIV
jgi:hypothetical protein